MGTQMILKRALPVQESPRTSPFQSKLRTTHTGSTAVESKVCQHHGSLWFPGSMQRWTAAAMEIPAIAVGVCCSRSAAGAGAIVAVAYQVVCNILIFLFFEFNFPLQFFC